MATRTRGRDKRGRLDPYAQRRSRYEALLGLIDLWRPFAAMPRRVQEAFWQRKLPDPCLVFDKSFPGGREHRAIRRAIEASFRAGSLQINGAKVAVRDFLAVITGCLLLVRGMSAGPTSRLVAEVARFLELALPALERCYEQHLFAAVAALYQSVSGPLEAHSRMDARLFAATLDFQTDVGGKVVPRVVISSVAPQVRRERVDGAIRPLFRVGRTGPNGMRWVSWKADTVGRAASGCQDYPVYIQSHALRQLHARANLPAAAPYVEAWLAVSFEEPNIVARRGQELLVEYRIKDYRIGYLVVTPLEELMVIRTFLFLTMEGTPEARLLRQRLRLSRRDTEWVGLHELAAFTQTDLRGDPVLRPLLEDCGCGQLFKLAEGDYAPQPRAMAAELRRYLNLAA